MSTFVYKPLPKHYSTSRALRNEAERQRRDRLNHYVSELATLVPFVKNAKKRVDKTSILRLAASYLRLHKVLRSDKSLSKLPATLNGETALRELFNSIGGFFLVITNGGKIIYASEAIEDSFGYTQSDVLGHCFYSFIHEEDRQLLRQQLQPKDSQRRSFYCRLMEKNSSRTDSNPRYQIIHIMGHMKNYVPFSEGDQPSSQEQHGSLINPIFVLNRKKKYANGNSSNSDFSREDETSSSSDETSSNTDSDSELLVAFVKVVRDRLVTELTWVESMRDEYITRHKLDGSMVHVDHRISFVTGFMPEEVLGNSAFYYMHPDDLCWSILAQKQMLLNGAGQGLVTYRLRCTDGSFVILRSRGFLEVDKDSGKVDTFICINTLLTVNTAKDEIKTQRKKLLPMLKDAPLASVEESFESGLPSELKSIVMKHGNFKKFIKVIGSVMSDPSEDIDLSRLMFDSTMEISQNGSEAIIGTPKDHEMQLGNEIIAKKRSFNQEDISSKLQRRSADTAVSVIPSDELSFPPSHKKRLPSPCTDFSCNSHSTPHHISGEISPSTDSETHWSDSENTTSFNKSLAMQNKRALSFSGPSNWNKAVENSATPNEYKNNYFLSVQPSYSEIQNWGYPNYSTDFSNHSSCKPSESLNNSENLFLPHNCISSGFGTAMENGCQKRDVSSGNHCNSISDP